MSIGCQLDLGAIIFCKDRPIKLYVILQKIKLSSLLFFQKGVRICNPIIIVNEVKLILYPHK